jgi:hypothetical protein
MIILLLANAIVALSAFILVKVFFPERKGVDSFLLGFLFLWAQIILVETVLGTIGKFYLYPIVLAHCAILLFLAVFASRVKTRPVEFDFAFLLRDKLLLFVIAVFLGFFMPLFFINLVNPPFYVDSQTYHLAFPALWIKQGNLVNPLVIWGTPRGVPAFSAVTYYPINAQLFFAWLILPLKNAFLADLGEAPFYLVGILAIYSILRKYGLRREAALFCGFLWVLIPNLLRQMLYGSMIDVICAATLLLVLNELLIFKEELNLKNALILGIGLGVFIGTKILNVVWAAAFLPLFLYCLGKNYRRTGAKNSAAAIGIIIIFTILFGGYIYIKNFVHTGNPVYPITINLFGRCMFHGLADSAAYGRVLGATVRFPDILWKEGLGGQFLLFVLPGTFIPWLFFRSIKGKAKPMGEYLSLFVAPALMALFYFAVIKIGWVRYLFPWLGIGIIATVIFLSKFAWGEKYLYGAGVIAVIASITKFANGPLLAVSLILTLLVFVLCLFAEKKGLSTKIVFNFKISAIIVLVTIVLSSWLNMDYDKNEFARYPVTLSKKEANQRGLIFGWQWLNSHTGTGKRIALVGRPEIYPLLGTRLKNEVFCVPVNAKSFDAYAPTDGFYRREKDFGVWLMNLRKMRADYIFIAWPGEDDSESKDTSVFPVEDGWCRHNPGYFKTVFFNSLVHIYLFADKGGTNG